MKGTHYICFLATLIVIFLSACHKTTRPDEEWMDLKDVPDNYSLEDAKRDGYVIIEDLSVTYGEDIWQDFVDLSAENTPCKVRVVHYYTLDNPSRYDPAYYESIKDDYSKMYILEIVYNGETFCKSLYEDEMLYQSEYKYLMRYEGKAETSFATFTSYIRYVLVNDDNVTWDDILHGMLSSQSGTNIPHSQIYTDLHYKDDGK
jgi:hypothetical protein